MTGRRGRGIAVAVLAVALLLVPAAFASRERRSDDPVSLNVKVHGVVAAKHKFPVTIKVTADAGALDIASQPLRLHVLLEPECGGSFEGSSGQKVMDRPLPAPTAGTAYSSTAKGNSKLKSVSTKTVCVFVSDADQRQYVTSTDVTVAATKGCTKQTKRLESTRKSYEKAHGDKRRKLSKKLKRVKRAQKKSCTAK